MTAPNLVPLAIEAYSKVFETMTGKDDKLGVAKLSSCVLASHKMLEQVNMPPNFKNQLPFFVGEASLRKMLVAKIVFIFSNIGLENGNGKH